VIIESIKCQSILFELQSEDEDDGVLIMSLLRSRCDNEVSLLILNARNMTEIGRVQFETCGPVPKCLHGLWMNTPVN
jgi:carotenoid isomerooxygenase